MAEENKEQDDQQQQEDDSNKQENDKRPKRRDETPIEELFDLSKPIPKAERPNKDEHEKELEAFTETFESLKSQRQAVQEKIDAAMDGGGRGSEISKERDALQQLRQQKGALIDEKKAIRAKLDVAKSQADKLVKDRKDTRSNVRFTNVEDIDAEIKKLQRRQETTSMSLTEEKKLIKEMDSLKASKSLVASLKSKETDLEDVKELRKTISTQIAAKDKEIDAVQKLIEEKQAAIKAMSEKETDKRDTVQTLFKERDELRKKITAVLKEKDQCRAVFREKNNAWFNYQRAVRAQKKMQYEEEKRKREEERQAWEKAKEEEEAKKIPYEEEQGLCDYLADYLTREYLSGGDTKKDEGKKDDVVAVKDDPFANVKPRKKDDDEVYFGKGKGKKKRVRASKQKKEPGPFRLNVDTFEQFGLLGLTPPTSVDMVEESVKALREKKEWYSKQPRGSVPTATEIRKANERAAAKIRQSNENGDVAAKPKDNKNFSLSNDDFAPLGAGGGSTSINSSWGQKPEAAPAVSGEAEE